MPTLTNKNIIEELEKDGSLSEIIKIEDFAEEGRLADQLAWEFRNTLKPTQLRKVFHAIKEIEKKFKGRDKEAELTSDDRAEITPLLPELAYARGRELIPKKFYQLMKIGLSQDKLKKVKDFTLLVQFLTAILAYHKYREKERR
jgi:CRISPR-associated protein Csm2